MLLDQRSEFRVGSLALTANLSHSSSVYLYRDSLCSTVCACLARETLCMKAHRLLPDALRAPADLHDAPNVVADPGQVWRPHEDRAPNRLSRISPPTPIRA